jgi:hypothetical protein
MARSIVDDQEGLATAAAPDDFLQERQNVMPLKTGANW